MKVSTVTRATRILAVLLSLLCFSSVLAQSEELHPLLQLLETIPNDAAAREWFTYVDFRAVTESREGAPSITTTGAFEALTAGDSLERDLFFAAYFGIGSGPGDFLSNLLRIAEGMLNATGIDPFSIERALTYGTPPGAVDVYFGDFDERQIAAAHSLRGYAENTVSGLTLWCGNDECEGTRMDLASRDPANPFGGNLGRQQAVLVGDGFVASSASTERLEQIAEAAAGEVDTLADSPNIRAAAEAAEQRALADARSVGDVVRRDAVGAALVDQAACGVEEQDPIACRVSAFGGTVFGGTPGAGFGHRQHRQPVAILGCAHLATLTQPE